MTNSYNLSQQKLPKLILIHGLNNHLSAFDPLKLYYEKLGYKCETFALPGHGEDRSEAKDFKTAFRYFDQRMKEVVQEPYVVIAFSQGALYLQLWLEKNQSPKPLAQVLLAPALFIHRYKLVQKVLRFLPSFLPIPSGSPKKIRRYPALYVKEYRTLLEGIKTYQSLKTPFRVPTYLVIDPKDELVAAEVLKKEVLAAKSFELVVDFEERSYLKNNIGHHHILFHPEYFEKDQWLKFATKINDFLKKYY